MKIYNKIKYLILFFIITILSFSLTFWAKTRLSLDTILQNTLNKALSNPLPDQIKNWKIQGNIFQKAYEQQQKLYTQQTLDIVSSITNYLNKKYSCNLSNAQVSLFLYQNENIYKNFNNILQIPPIKWFKNINEYYKDFYNACKQLKYCIYNKARQENENFVFDWKMYWKDLQNCVSLATKAYFLSNYENTEIKNIKKDIVWENIYFDWNPDNWAYDLLIDIDLIWDILFKHNKKSPETIFFEMPKVNISQSNKLEEENQNNNTTDQSTNNTNNDTINSWNNNTWEQNNTILSWDQVNNADYNKKSPDLAFSTKNNTQNSYSIQNKGLVLWNICNQDQSWNSINYNKKLPDSKQIENQLQDFYNNLTAQLQDLQSYTSTPQIENPENNTNNPIPTTNDNNPNKQNNDNNQICNQTCTWDNQWKKELCLTNCCLKNCKNYYDNLTFTGTKAQIAIKKYSAKSDKLVCISQCLCSEFSWPKKPEDFTWNRDPVVKYRIKFCRIPVQTLPIIPKKIYSIQEAVEEINNIIKKLKESWQLMQHVKTKEMFDTSMKNIKFWDILGFNMFVKIKPMRNVLSYDQAKQNQKDLSNQRDETLRNSKSLELEEERNKYILLYNPTKTKAKKSYAKTYAKQLEELINLEKLKKNKKIDNLKASDQIELQIYWRWKVLDKIAKFVLANAEFRNTITETMNTFNSTAENLRKKVEKEE